MCCTDGNMSECFALGFGSCLTNRLRKTSSVKFFSMCSARPASLKADLPVAPGSRQLRGSGRCRRRVRPAIRKCRCIRIAVKRCARALAHFRRKTGKSSIFVYCHRNPWKRGLKIVGIPENTVKTRLFCAQEIGRAAEDGRRRTRLAAMAISKKILEQEPNEIEMLLPWHAAGTLNTRDARRVDDALARDSELAKRYALIQEEYAETIHLNESLGAPSARAMQKLFAAIDGAPARPPSGDDKG